MNYYNKFFAGTLAGVLTLPCVAQIDVVNAWVQLAPPGATVNAAYMTLHNPQLHAQTIVGVSADCCAMTMLHHTRKHGDKVSMEHLDLLVVPAQASVQLAPGGLHIMLMKPGQDLAIGSEVKLTFSFSDGTRQDLNISVKKNEP